MNLIIKITLQWLLPLEKKSFRKLGLAWKVKVTMKNYMLNKFCHKLGFSAAGWSCNNARERVLETLVHLSLN